MSRLLTRVAMSVAALSVSAIAGGALTACTGAGARVGQPSAAPQSPSTSAVPSSPSALPGSSPTSGAPGAAPVATGGPASAPASAVPAYYVGAWQGHRRDMTVRADGTASFSVSIPVGCGQAKPGQPCGEPGGMERLDLRITLRAGTPYATVVRSNDTPDDPVGTVYRFVPAADHTFLMQWVQGAGGNHDLPAGIRMCSPAATKDMRACGA